MNLSALDRHTAERGLPCLLIGGHAVIAHGHPRNTFDLDLAVPRAAVVDWRSFALSAGYTLYREGGAFLQFNSPDDESLPLDLMIVSDETFQRLDHAAVATPDAALGMRTVSLEHLLAMKSHAIRHGHLARVEKDMDDVIELVRANRIDVSRSEWRDLFRKHGPPELYEKLLRIQNPEGI